MKSPFAKNFYRLTIILLAVMLTFSSRYASAELTSVVINSTVPLGEFDGKPYLEATGFMKGNVAHADGSPGDYSVPLTIQYPASPTDCNGFAIGEPLHNVTGPAALLIGRNYIFGHGYVHAAVGWDKSDMTSSIKGRSYGDTKKLEDAYQVLKDLAGLLRDPAPFIQGPCAADRVIAYGASLTGFFWRDFLRLGNNNPLLFDGLLINAAGAQRLDLSVEPKKFVTYPGPLPQDGKILAINGEHDVERYQGWKARPETPFYRVYEVAGVPHTPKSRMDLAPLGATRQNPVDHVPVVKAMLQHLHDWIANGIEPPPSVTMPGIVIDTPPGDLVPPTGCTPTPTTPCPIYQFIRDDFGNATGGVRLPHMEVPIGTYTGVETNLTAIAPANRGPVSRGGTFTPFDQEMLKELYPNHGSYVRMITDAAGTARDHGWILGEDVGGYTSDGSHLSIGKPTIDEDFVSEEP